MLRKQAVFALLIALAVSACAKEEVHEKTWQNYFDDAKFLDIQQNRTEARQNYDAALKNLVGVENEQEWRAEILARLARLDVIDGKLDNAETLANEAMKLALDPKLQGPNHGEVLVALDDLAESYSERSYKSKPEQIRCLEMAIKILDLPFGSQFKKVRERSVRELAIAYVISGQKEKAAPLEKSIAENADSYAALRDVAAAYHFTGDTEKEKKFLDLAQKTIKKKHPKGSIEATYAMRVAELYQQNARFDDAIKVINDYIDSVKPRPVSPDFYETLATLYEGKGDNAKARSNFETAIAMDRKRNGKQKILRNRMESYARFLRRINATEEAAVLQKEADYLRDEQF